MTALAQPVFWMPQADPAAIILAPAPVPAAGLHLTADELRTRGKLMGDGGTLIQLAWRGERFDASLQDQIDGQALGRLEKPLALTAAG
jgi:hypothetical protein